jgi:hypothetical protein
MVCYISAFHRPVASPAADRLGAYTQLGEPALLACHPALRPSASRCWAAPLYYGENLRPQRPKNKRPFSANSRREAVMNRPPAPQLWHEVSRQESTAWLRGRTPPLLTRPLRARGARRFTARTRVGITARNAPLDRGSRSLPRSPSALLPTISTSAEDRIRCAAPGSRPP